MKIGSWLVGLICCVAVLVCPLQARAEGALEVVNSSVRGNFPADIVFSIEAKSSSTISSVRLRYSVDQIRFGDILSEGYVEFTPSTDVTARWKLDMKKVGDMPPGTKITYWWFLADSAGKKLETDRQTFLFEDKRFSWQSLDDRQVTLYWYSMGASTAQELMGAAQQALKRLTGETGVTLSRPIRVYLYASVEDLRGARVYAKGWEGGVAYPDFQVILLAMPSYALNWAKMMVSHEASHMVTRQLTLNPYGWIPVWLNEGLASYAEGDLSPNRTDRLRKDMDQKRLLTVRTLASQFSSDSDTANLSYTESRSIVDYLITEHGRDKLVQLLAAYKDGATYDAALEKVYGFDMDGLDAAWRKYGEAKWY